ncbi:hypothetical protein, partial [Acetobacter farinalis]
CSKRRSKTNPKVVNQIAKSLKSPAKRINQGFFDPSRFCVCKEFNPLIARGYSSSVGFYLNEISGTGSCSVSQPGTHHQKVNV